MNAEMDAVSGEVTEGEWSDAAVTVADCPELVCDARREDYYTQFTGGTVVADCAEEDGTKCRIRSFGRGKPENPG